MTNQEWLDGLIPEAEDWARELIAAKLDAAEQQATDYRKAAAGTPEQLATRVVAAKRAVAFAQWMADSPEIFIGAFGRAMVAEALELWHNAGGK